MGRLGGDEFAILLPHIADIHFARHLVETILNVMSAPFELKNHQIVVTPSIGVSLFPEDAITAEESLRNSGIAMSHAKREGKNLYRFFDERMNEEANRNIQIESALGDAIEQNELVLYYQPQIEAFSNRVYGVEALIRWNSASLGMVRPDQFISLAEKTGQIIKIGEWVLREACRQIKCWQDQGVFLERIAVNVSARQFARDDFVDLVVDVLNETGIDPCLLELEVTESLLMEHANHAVGMLRQLKDIGVKLAIDDFGTGYSSLSYLKQFPIDHLKIDKAFIDNLVENDSVNDQAIVTAIIAMAHSMGMSVTAEGVENIEQLNFLVSQKCNEIQGYYFSPPLPSDLLVDYIPENQKNLSLRRSDGDHL